MRKSLAALVVALITAGGAVAASAPAAATEPGGVCVPAAAWTETIPPVGEPTVTIPNPDYVPAQDAVGDPTIEQPNPDYVPGTDAVGPETIEQPNLDYVPAQDAQYVTEYEHRHMILAWKVRWTRGEHPGLGWVATGATRDVEVSPAQDAIGDPTVTVPNPDYQPAQPPQGEPTITVPNPDYQPPREAIGDEKIEVPNDAYQEGRTVEHDAVTCQDDVTAQVSARCLDGTAYLAVRVDNGTGGPLTIRSDLTGTHDVAAGATFTQAYNQRTDTLDRGRVFLALRNEGGAWNETLRYGALSCEVTPPTDKPTEEPSAPVDEPSAPVEGPTDEPTPDVAPVSNPVTVPADDEPVAEPVAATSPNPVQRQVDAAESGETYESLASTGTSAGGLALAGSLAAAVGVLLVAARRRHRAV